MANDPGEAAGAATRNVDVPVAPADRAVGQEPPARDLAAAFAGFCVAVVRRLPFGLSRAVAPTLLGFALINGCTFGLDLLLHTLLHGVMGVPVAASIVIAYGCALAVAFVLNRVFNFRSHAPVGRQTALYVVVVAINFAGLVLGVGAGLTALGVQYQLSRLLAGLCEAIFMYCAMRWVVFRGTRPPVS